MRLLPTLALAMTLLAGGLVGGEAFGRDRDRDRHGHRDDDGGGYFGGGREASLVQRRNRGGDDDSDSRSSRMSPSQAAREAQQRYGGGRVLSVDSMGGGYRVKLLRDGDVRVVFISDH
jgi:hypothetical protein